MAPSALTPPAEEFTPSTKAPVSAVIHRSLKTAPPQVVSSEGSWVTFSNGQKMLDTTCGAAVACIGHRNSRVKAAMIEQIDAFSYCNSMFFGTSIGEELCQFLIEGTDHKLAKALIMCSGSEAMDAAMKMARQYFMEVVPRQEKRTKFIARECSYHGTTWGALSVGGHMGRRELFEPMLLHGCEKVSPCNEYRGRKAGQSVEQYVEVLAKELDDKFQEMGPETVIAFVAEPVVGAALGAVPAVPGYFKAMKAVCDKYGALLILDEVMSGMGRCGTLHVWQQEGIVPHIQTIAKGLGGGFAPIAGLLIDHQVADALTDGSGAFVHGQTYQGHPVSCAAALEVQRIMKEGKLVENAMEIGIHLGELLHEYLDPHPHVGNVRGKGLFWGVEFVADKATKDPFPPSMGVANAVHYTALSPEFGISLYPGMGTVDGVLGDHVLLAPAYNLTKEDIRTIAELTRDSIVKSFQVLCKGCSSGTCH